MKFWIMLLAFVVVTPQLTSQTRLTRVDCEVTDTDLNVLDKTRTTWEYYDDGQVRLYKESDFVDDLNVYRRVFQVFTTYDANGRIAKEDTEITDTDLNVLEKSRKTWEYYDDGQVRLYKESDFVDDLNVYRRVLQLFTTYDDNGLIAKEDTEVTDTDLNVLEKSRKTWEYYDDGQIRLYKESDFVDDLNDTDLIVLDKTRKTWEYNDDGKVRLYKESDFVDGLNVYRRVLQLFTTYDDNGLIAKEDTEVTDTDLNVLDKSRKTWEYYDDGQIRLYKESDFVDDLNGSDRKRRHRSNRYRP